MLKIDMFEVVGWCHAIRGMRNPLNSWDKDDSDVDDSGYLWNIGAENLNLMSKLRNAGPDHRKFMRMLVVYVDIDAPLYWWKEFDTYKVGTTANSCSTMHTIHTKEFTLDDFSHEHLYDPNKKLLLENIRRLNDYREAYVNATALSPKHKDDWWQLIQLLPSSYNQKRTVMLNYEVLTNIYRSRHNHKLDEWHTLSAWIEQLPQSELITGKEGEFAMAEKLEGTHE